MKKNFIVSLSVAAMLLSGVEVCFASDVYFCPEQSNGYIFTDLYDPSGNCEAWNSDFFRKSGSDVYNECLQRRNRQKQMLSQGKCEKVLQKSFSYGNQNCTFKIIPSKNSITETSCFAIGPNPLPLKDIQEEFKRRFGYK